MSKKALIKAAGTRRKQYDVVEAIRKLRMNRETFRTDTPEETVENLNALVERGHAFMQGQFVPGKHHASFAEVSDSKVANMSAAQRTAYIADIERERMHAAVLMKLTLEIPAHSPTAVTTAERIDDLASDYAGYWRDGFQPHERREIEQLDQWERRHVEKPVSSETIRHSSALYPEQRYLLLNESIPLIADKEAIRQTPAWESRFKWRNRELLKACSDLHALVGYLDRRGWNDKEVEGFREQYRFADLVWSNSKTAPISDMQRLGIAIASADQKAMGSRQFQPDDDLAYRVSRAYGRYLSTLSARKTTRNLNSI